jgi:hypothetical protein
MVSGRHNRVSGSYLADRIGYKGPAGGHKPRHSSSGDFLASTTTAYVHVHGAQCKRVVQATMEVESRATIEVERESREHRWYRDIPMNVFVF